MPKTSQPKTQSSPYVREQKGESPSIISINTDALKAKMHQAQEVLVKWGRIIQEQLPEKEQVVRFGNNLKRWTVKQYEIIKEKIKSKSNP